MPEVPLDGWPRRVRLGPRRKQGAATEATHCFHGRLDRLEWILSEGHIGP